jgi:hypothetical protein
MNIAFGISKLDHLEENIKDERKSLKLILRAMVSRYGLEYFEIIFSVIKCPLVC